MKILFLTAEVGPYVAVGGLSQVSYFLPMSLQKEGEDVQIFTPKFGAMDPPNSDDKEIENKKRKVWKLEMEVEGLRVPLLNKPGDDDLICNVKSFQSKGGVKTCFLENQEYYELRANVFGYKDDHVRFMLMCKGCLEWLLLQKINGGWWPDVIHCNDWHAAYLIELARTVPRYKKIFSDLKIVLTVHNFIYQGNFDFKYCGVEDRDDGKAPLLGILDERLYKQNALLRGIMWADAISTVSPTHAREVVTEEYGEGLSKILAKKKEKLVGILNGLDIVTFNPAKDKLLKARFNEKNFIKARGENKVYLQGLFNLPVKEDVFLLAYVGRLTQQKGLTMMLGTLPHLLAEYPNIQIVVLGGGDDIYRNQLTLLYERYPNQVGLHLIPNFRMPRKIFAGADGLLIPSLFEPGGIVALESLRYGAVPIVRRTGGLNDIVEDFQPMGRGNGFSFLGRNAWSLYGAVVSAMTTFRNKDLWYKLVKNCLEADFSWDFVAREYKKWYLRVRMEE
ncbi:MAG: glycogen/starch synthase [bacterium]